MTEFLLSIIKWLNRNSGIAIITVILIFILERIFKSRSNYRSKINLLEAVKKELEWNQQWITDLVEDEQEDSTRYYDPTRANFKCGNDIISYAVTHGQSLLRSKIDLIQALVIVNDAIKQYNQQVQEQHDCRFSSPEITAIATSLYQKNPNILKNWMCDSKSRPSIIADFLIELRLRNWAINTRTKNYLRPALINAFKLIENELNYLVLNNKWWHFWKG
ncbi:hypothetical protein A2215_00790 [Candidatus Berkelbacteria bacterium RIFOXYA2_FULL_43_10]|uniref:DUF4760 domain-containing protein n=1 Tax=Candidatus Berkelbacteria bacterium RIFOXYA2_FULL_43_10 TaxID=1797472 RepID=A0A1F5E922_9BACT|nr:MAG: hypothetical protein A2215_00790 [Candidatus Berkelbacteria bacterium RIFOXYA2_FULL_43_10]